jgi:hypothetical protein
VETAVFAAPALPHPHQHNPHLEFMSPNPTAAEFPVAHSPKPTTHVRISRRRHRRGGSGPTDSGRALPLPLANAAPVRPSTATRDRDADQYRRCQSSFLAWMKSPSGPGSSGESENPPQIRPLAMAVHTESAAWKSPADPVAARPDLYPPSATAGVKTTVTITSAAVPEPESDWRSRRRLRRMALT